MKKLDLLVVKSFIGPFILTFFISLFVLVMQFLWMYIDDLVGKGLDTWILIKLLVYASAALVPLALPLAVLLASIMTYGSFGEHFELTAVKSAGISLLRFMQPLVFTVMVISLFAFYFSNNVLPYANLKRASLIYDIQHQKPTVALKPGIFFSGIDGYFIRAGQKDDKTNTLFNILVYDHTSGHGDDHVITASKGSLTQDENAMALTLRLEDGRQYREMDKDKANEPNTHEMMSTSFASWEKRFDLSQFKLSHTDENFFKSSKKMLKLKQLLGQIDSIHMDERNLKTTMTNYTLSYANLKRFGIDTLQKDPDVAFVPFKDITDSLSGYDKTKRIQIMEIAMTRARNIKNFADVTTKQMEFKYRDYVNHMTEVYRKFTLSIACMVFFFIGAPLGSIIRRGGLGWPLFYSVIFFIIYHITSMAGEKLAESELLTVFGGMWLSTLVLLPIGFFLTLKASSDSKIYSADYYTGFMKRIFSFKNSAA